MCVVFCAATLLGKDSGVSAKGNRDAENICKGWSGIFESLQGQIEMGNSNLPCDLLSEGRSECLVFPIVLTIR